MRPTAFRPQPLPEDIDVELRRRLCKAHAEAPFSAAHPRQTARRVVEIAGGLGLATTMYRGGVDLQGTEVDHVWLDVGGRVVDAAFPLYRHDFVSLLREYVAGDVSVEALELSAINASVDQRVLGLFPARIRYLGAPVWNHR